MPPEIAYYLLKKWHIFREKCPLERARIRREWLEDERRRNAAFRQRYFPKPVNNPMNALKYLKIFSHLQALPHQVDGMRELDLIINLDCFPGMGISCVLLAIKAASYTGVLVDPQLSGICTGIKAAVGSKYTFKKLRNFSIFDKKQPK